MTIFAHFSQRSAGLLAAALVFAAPLGAAAQDQTGVAACDGFIARYQVCIDTKVPSEHQPQFRATIKQLRGALVPMASNPQTRGGVEGACLQIAEMIKQQTAAFGCDW